MLRRFGTIRRTFFIVALLAQLAFVLVAAPETAAAAPCPPLAPALAAGNPPPAGKLPTLPQTGGGGAADFCLRFPGACKSGGPGPGFSAASGVASAAPGPAGGALAFAGSAPGRGPGTLLMLALPVRLAACPVGAPGIPDPALPMSLPCPPPPPAPTIDGRAVAQGLAIPWPALRIGVNPATWGLVGLPTRFWVAGYDGRPLQASASVSKPGLPGPPGCPSGPGASLTVTVQAVIAGYDWNFGDGLATSRLTTTNPGRPYPQVSPVQHEYTNASAAGFPVTLSAHFALTYAAGGNWQPLGNAARSATIAYRVQQAIPVVVNPGEQVGGKG